MLAGEFTSGSIEQLTSLGFHVLYFPYNTIVSAFASRGIDIAFDESTPDYRFRESVELLEQLPSQTLDHVKQHLLSTNEEIFKGFLDALQTRLNRLVERVVLIPLYGRSTEFASVDGVLEFLDSHNIYEGSGAFRKYEILVTFSNGDRVEGAFTAKQRLKDFLEFIITQYKLHPIVKTKK